MAIKKFGSPRGTQIRTRYWRISPKRISPDLLTRVVVSDLRPGLWNLGSANGVTPGELPERDRAEN